jgi:dTDP-4-dehydrorhamnose reductase
VTDVLVIGASGLLGEHLLAEAKRRGIDAIGTYAGDPVKDLVPLNLSDLVATVRLLRDRHPKTVLLPAAITGVDACEAHPDQAQLVNADAPREIAKACHTLGARLVFFSTDYVFDGRRGPFNERRQPQPLNVYGRTKLTGERNVLAAHPEALVVRTSANFGWNRSRRKTNSVTWILELLRRRQVVPLFVDQRVSPSYAPAVAGTAFDLLDRGASGIFHVATRSYTTRLEIGLEICDVFRLPKELLKATRLADVDLKASRPSDSSLDVGKVERFLDKRSPTFHDALTDMRETE